jgi:DNA-binding CsgD family transcriptional regulator
VSDDAPFVGRAAELAALCDAFESARSGRARVVGVEGAAGMGKSALLRRFLAVAAIPTVLSASGEEAETELAFGVTAQLRAAAMTGRGRPAAGSHGTRPTTKNLRWPAPSAADDPLDAGAGLLDVLDDLQASGTVALVVDDLHWADRQSVQALLFAARRLAFDHVMVLVAYRQEEAAVLGDGWRRLLEAGHAERIRLPGLSAAEVASLSRLHGLALDAGAARRLTRHSGGSPLHALALLREVDPAVLTADDGPLPAPHSMAGVVRAELERCPDDAAGLVAAAAVLGERARLADAAAVAGLSASPARPLSQACRAGLLTEGPTAAEISFPHALVRAAVLSAVGPERRNELHRRAAAVLTNDAAITHRLAASTGTDDALADDLMRMADGRSGAGDLAGAGRYRLQAARLSRLGMLRDARMLTALEDMLDAGDLAQALTARDELLALPASARRSALIGDIALWQGRFGEAEAALSEAWKRLDSEGDSSSRDGRLFVVLAIQLAFLMLLMLRFDEAVRWAETALLVGASVDVIVGAAAEILCTAGHGDRARALLSDLGPAELVPPDRLSRLSARGTLRMCNDDLAGARADLSCVLARTEAGETHRLPGRVAGRLGEACYRAGDLDEAVVYSELACAIADEVGRGWDFAYLHGIAALPRAARGEFALARGHFQEALAWARSSGSETSVQFAALAAAALAAAGCNEPDILHVAAQHPVCAEPGVQPLGPAAVDALLSLGRIDDAEASLTYYEERAAYHGRRSALAETARVRGRLEAARGRTDTAVAAFTAGLHYIAGLGQPIEEARLHLDYADVLLTVDRAAPARSHYSAAAGLLEPLRARPYLDRALTGLAKARGRRRTPASTSTHPATALSPQERTVANLVAEGLSNREIARRLTLSVKTIEYHLSNVYDKLGLRSRAALAVRIASLRGDPHGSAAERRAGPPADSP